MDNNLEFPQGLIFKLPRDKAPDFIKGSLSIKRAELIQWLNSKSDEWINLDLKEGKSGKGYAVVNTWKPEGQTKKPMGNIESNFMEDAVNSSTPDDLPF